MRIDVSLGRKKQSRFLAAGVQSVRVLGLALIVSRLLIPVLLTAFDERLGAAITIPRTIALRPFISGVMTGALVKRVFWFRAFGGGGLPIAEA